MLSSPSPPIRPRATAAAAPLAALQWKPVDSFAGNFTSPVLAPERPCPICGSLAARAISELRDFQFYSDSRTVPKRMTLTTSQCLGCFALYLNPCYSKLGFRILFAEAGQSYGATAGRAGEQIAWLEGRGLLATGALVLDVGCHDGAFLAALPAGVRRLGVDIDSGAVARGRARFAPEGVELVCADLERFTPPAPPDTITMFHVLEHLPRPVRVLEQLRAGAHRGTRLVVEVPILEKGATADVNGFFSVQHMTHFSRASLRSCLGRSGWRLTDWCEQPDYNGCRVVAEPGTPADGARPADDAVAVHEHLAWRHAALADLGRRLEALRGVARLAIWGAGAHVEMLYQVTSLFHAEPQRTYVLVDGDPGKQGRSWRGIDIHAPALLARPELAAVPLLVSSYGSQEEIARAAVELGVPPGYVVRLYQDVRVY